ncbi:MAG: NADH-quinone oxidoreductase subunit J [Dehalococcoidia bacterium]|nr:NADH-quinone oxidoreductase subunit J [Chloroflexota bacterium]
MLFQDFIFWALAVGGVAAALGVVLLRDIFRAALLLIVVFLTIAGHFFLLAAEFVGVVQVLIYAGAISILIIFAIMLTQNVQQGNLPNRLQIPAVLLPALLLSALIFVFVDTDWRLTEALPNAVGVNIVNLAFEDTTFKLSKLLLENYALAFGAAGALLLASIIGALSLVRER